MRDDAVIGKLGQQEWLKPAEDGLQQAIHKAFEIKGGRQAKNFLHGTWIGHPLHVILTDVPIGAWTVAIVFDALDSMGSRREYRVAADAALGLGLVGAVGAAATGLTDWQDTDPPARRIGLIHGLLNVASVVLFGSSFLARRRDIRTTARGLAALGYAVSVAAAKLGGNLGDRHPLADHPQDLEFAVGQVIDERHLLIHPRGQEPLDHDGLHAVADVNTAVQDLADRHQEFFGGLLLHHVAPGAGSESAVGIK